MRFVCLTVDAHEGVPDGLFFIMEKELVIEYLNVFRHEWNVYEEICGKSLISGNRKRIDAIIISKTHPHIKFGIEFKRLDLNSFNKFTHWFKQSIIYTQSHCESWAGAMKRIIGEFGIGEIEKLIYHNGLLVYSIRFKETRLWSNAHGYNANTIKMDFNKYLEL